MPASAKQINAGFWQNRTNKKYTVYYPDGRIYIEGDLKAGLSDGIWQYFSHAGVVTTRGSYQNGLRDGLWQYRNTTGQIYLQLYYAAEPKRLDYLILSGNKVGNENGPYKRFYESGVLEEKGFYKGGSLHGPVHHYYPASQLAYTGNYREDKKSGLWQYFFPDGVVKREEIYLNGLLHGQLKNYYPNGELYNESRWENGKLLNGPWIYTLSDTM